MELVSQRTEVRDGWPKIQIGKQARQEKIFILKKYDGIRLVIKEENCSPHL